MQSEWQCAIYSQTTEFSIWLTRVHRVVVSEAGTDSFCPEDTRGHVKKGTITSLCREHTLPIAIEGPRINLDFMVSEIG